MSPEESLVRVPPEGADVPPVGAQHARPARPRLGIGAQVIACNEAHAFLLGLTHGRAYWQLGPERRAGWRTAMQTLRERRDDLLMILRERGVPSDD